MALAGRLLVLFAIALLAISIAEHKVRSSLAIYVCVVHKFLQEA